MTKRTSHLFPCGLLVVLAVVGPAQAGCEKRLVWTKPVHEEMVLATKDLTGLEVRTHNGAISFAPIPEGASQGRVAVVKKAGGRDAEDAQVALEAIEVFVTPSDSGTTTIGWKWKGVKKDDWSGHVDFTIEAPGQLTFDGRTHNGPIKVTGIQGDVNVQTHNGPISVDAGGGTLDAQSHNGPVAIVYTGAKIKASAHNGPIQVDAHGGTLEVRSHNGPITVRHDGESVDITAHSGPIQIDAHGGTLRARSHDGPIAVKHDGESVDIATHNGPIDANLSRTAVPRVQITTHNGQVAVLVSEEASARVNLKTDGGDLECDVPLDDAETDEKQTRMTGVLGDGDGLLEVTTHTGRITISGSPE